MKKNWIFAFLIISMNVFAGSMDTSFDVTKDCLICFEALEEKYSGTGCDCHYLFHEDCLTPHLKKSPVCPTCKKNHKHKLTYKNGGVVASEEIKTKTSVEKFRARFVYRGFFYKNFYYLELSNYSGELRDLLKLDDEKTVIRVLSGRSVKDINRFKFLIDSNWENTLGYIKNQKSGNPLIIKTHEFLEIKFLESKKLKGSMCSFGRSDYEVTLKVTCP